MQRNQRQRLHELDAQSHGRWSRPCCSPSEPSNSNSAAMASRSSGRIVPATAPDPSGHTIQPLAAIRQTIHVAQKHLDIRQQPMRHQHRLGALQMRVSRHGALSPGGFRLLHDLRRAYELRASSCDDLIDLLAHVQAAGRWRSARCGCGRYAACIQLHRQAPPAASRRSGAHLRWPDRRPSGTPSAAIWSSADSVADSSAALRTPAFASADACALLAATSYGSSMRSKGNDRCHCSNSASGAWPKRPDHIFIARLLHAGRRRLRCFFQRQSLALASARERAGNPRMRMNPSASFWL